MADVRLTATNPEDSSVVPVACDAAGRLLLEEPQVIEGPPGPPGEQGPPGQDGDPFSGNFAGDVTFGGSATFNSTVTAPFFSVSDGSFGANNIYASLQNTGDRARLFMSNTDALGDDEAVIDITKGASGTEILRVNANGSATFAGVVSSDQFSAAGSITCGTGLGPNSGYALRVRDGEIVLFPDGSAEFAGAIRSGSGESITSPKTPCSYIQDSGGVFTYRSDANRTASVFEGGVANGTNAPQRNVILYANGGASFAGNKAGFTAEGYLWCTTERGDTVYLQGTSQGVGIWAEYTPTTRLEEIRDKLDANRGDTGEMPADTQ